MTGPGRPATMSNPKSVLASLGIKVALLVVAGVVAALVVTFTVEPGPGSISLAGAAWGLAIWLGVLTVAFVALLWQLTTLNSQISDDDS